MNNIIKEVEELKQLVIESNEYKDYKKYLEIIENNNEIKKIIDKITNMQKEIVRDKSRRKDIQSKENELDKLYIQLNEYEEYSKYIEASKKLNLLITNIQNNFQKFFDSLVS